MRCGPAWLHHNFVCQLLNDLFGVQVRGGCQCAGSVCAAGKYEHDRIVCKSCVAGRFQAAAAKITCTNCPAGRVHKCLQVYIVVGTF